MRNQFEEQIALELTMKGVEYEYESEEIPYVVSSVYIPDFVFRSDLGENVYLECKGHFRREDQRKLTAVRKQHPNLKLYMVFYRSPAKRIQKWLTKMKIEWSTQTIPIGLLTVLGYTEPARKRKDKQSSSPLSGEASSDI